MNDPSLKVCVLGAAPDTGNLGVSALCLSTLQGLARRIPGVAATVFDHGRGVADAEAHFDKRQFVYTRCGLHNSRLLHRRESLLNVRLSARFGGAGNPAAEAIRQADAILDITGGDSFTDLYGTKRFRGGCRAKRLAIKYSGGLVLLPQTYGPYRERWTRREAEGIVRSAAAAWARDLDSFGILRSLLGDAFDPSRHHSGVDVAFRLGSSEPREAMPAPLAKWLAAGRTEPIVGINASGLIYMRPDEAARKYGLTVDYRAALRGVVDRLLSKTRARIVLVPHVLAPPGHFESDRDACAALIDVLGGRARDRVVIAPDLSAGEAKWLISHLDWFCGTRMHSTIAALSSGVPAAAMAYSAKTSGVFATCGQDAHVTDLRRVETDAAVDAVWSSWERRADARSSLAAALPQVLATADRQMDEIVATCRRLAAARRGVPAARED